MTTKIGINGFGRIGRLTFRAIKKYHDNDVKWGLKFLRYWGGFSVDGKLSIQL